MRFRQKMGKGDLVGSTKKFPITSIVGKDARLKIEGFALAAYGAWANDPAAR